MNYPRHLTLVLASSFFFYFSGKSQKPAPKQDDYTSGYNLFWGPRADHQLDSAFSRFDRYVNSNPIDTFQKGMAYYYMGEILWNVRDFSGTEENLTYALHTFDRQNIYHWYSLGNVYNLLGNIRKDAQRYNEALVFFDSALVFSHDPDLLTQVMNGKATTLQRVGQYAKAIAIYDSILYLKPTDQSILAMAIDNRARTKWLQDPDYPALPEMRAALKIRVDSQYNLQMDASYEHLSDFYAKSIPDSALWYAQKMHEIATENKDPVDILNAIDKLVQLNSSPAMIKKWYARFKHLNDSIQLSRSSAQNRFALIKYDFQKGKADNLVLQQHITRQRLWTYFAAGTGIMIILVLVLFFNRRRKRIKQESENAIRDANLKISKRVHDVVANGLYGIMNELEHGKELEREPLITKIEELYEDSRDISYEDMPHASKNYYNKIHELLSSFTSEQTDVFVVGNEQTFWEQVSDIQKYELSLMLKNLMINMKRHSGAKNVIVQFRQENNRAAVTYKDDGIGLSEGSKFGNGLNNTVSRIKSLNGDINFGKSEKGGVLITISFPLQSSTI